MAMVEVILVNYGGPRALELKGKIKRVLSRIDKLKDIFLIQIASVEGISEPQAWIFSNENVMSTLATVAIVEEAGFNDLIRIYSEIYTVPATG